MTTAPFLPVFAYGTLRPGHGNHSWIADDVLGTQTATMNGLALFDNGAFPYAVENPASAITGDLLHLDPTTYPRALRHLDHLEGFQERSPAHTCHYLRIIRETTTGVRAFIYLAGPRATARIDSLPRIPSGDWSLRHLAHQ